MRYIVLFLGFLLPSMCFGQTAVRTGEHEGFTRVVVPFPAEMTWLAEELSQGIELRFDSAVRFSFDTAFDRISAERVIGFDQTETSIQISFGCDCNAQIYEYQSRYIIVDVFDGPPDVANEPMPDQEQGEEDEVAQTLRPFSFQYVGQPEFLRPQPQPPEPAAGEVLAHDSGENSSQVTPVLPEQLNTTLALAERLADAVASGLLDANDSALTPQSDTHMGTGLSEQEVQLSVSTGFVNADGQRAVVELNPNGLTCDQSGIAISGWSEMQQFHLELGRHRAHVINDLGAVDPSRAIDLAELYINYGFGAEAIYWLSQIDAPPPPLLGMAQFLNNRPPPNFPTINSYSLCGGQELIWRLADGGVDVAISTSQLRDIQFQFLNLSDPLKRILGPRLVRALRDNGYLVQAENVREALVNSGDVPIATAVMLALDNEIIDVDQIDENALRDMISGERSRSPDALAQYLSIKRQRGDTIEIVELGAAHSLLFEANVQPTAGGLWNEVILGYIEHQDGDQVLDLLPNLHGASHAAHVDIMNSVYARVLDTEYDSLLVVLSTRSLQDATLKDLDNEIRARVLTRLDELGLGEIFGVASLGTRQTEDTTDQDMGVDVSNESDTEANPVSNPAVSNPSFDFTDVEASLNAVAQSRNEIQRLLD